MTDFTNQLIKLFRMESAAERLRDAASHSKNAKFIAYALQEARKLQKTINEVNKYFNSRHI